MRIETTVSFMSEIIHGVKSGRMAPAVFQRPFVWGEKDVLALWHSILKGYPLGSILLWKPHTPSPHAKKTLGPITLEAKKDALLILDGQNRLITIAWSLVKPDTKVDGNVPGANIFQNDSRLVADPYLRTIRFAPKDEVHGMMMPLHYLDRETSAFYRTHWQSDEDNDHMEWIEGIARNFRETRIVATTIHNATPNEARDAFIHISKVGVPIRKSDFDEAMAYELGE